MELVYVYKKELNSKAKERMLAVLNVVAEGETISTIAKLFHKSYNSIKNCVIRFKEFGIAGLYEEPRSGRQTKLVNHKITEFFASVKNGIFPKQLVRQIKKDTGVSYTEYVPCCVAITLLQMYQILHTKTRQPTKR